MPPKKYGAAKKKPQGIGAKYRADKKAANYGSTGATEKAMMRVAEAAVMRNI